jgi:hypothetical protein
MSDREREVLLEAALTVHRERDSEGRVSPPSAWFDLPPEALDDLFAHQLLAREMERGIDPRGMSGTVRSVLARLGP